MKNVKRFMLDIETLDTSGPAVLLQISVAGFDKDEEVFNVKLDKDAQPKSTTSEATLKWWAKQGPMPKGTADLEDSLNDLRAYLNKADEVWCHDFDKEILFNVCEAYGIKKPFHYKTFRCIRTLVALSGINLSDFNWDKKTHDALDDCRFQIEYCTVAMDKINPELCLSIK